MFQDLSPDNYYVWSVCVELVPSQTFLRTYDIHLVGDRQTICADNVTYKTLGEFMYHNYLYDSPDAAVRLNSCTVLMLLAVLSLLCRYR